MLRGSRLWGPWITCDRWALMSRAGPRCISHVRSPRLPSDISHRATSLCESRAIHCNQPVSSTVPMTQFVSDELASRQLEMELISFFAGLALLLAAIGLYGL